MSNGKYRLPIATTRRPRSARLPPTWLDDWAEEMESLRSQLVVRPKSRRGDAPWDNWSGRVRTHLYRLVLRYRAERRLRIIYGVVATLDREPLKVPFRSNPFYWALYAARHDGEVFDLSDKDLSRFSAQMLYADAHRIVPELLVGFVYQQGNERDLRRKLAQNEKEPWFVG